MGKGNRILIKWERVLGTRANPTRYTTGYLLLKPLSTIIKRTIDDLHLGPDATVVDLGCGDMPYVGFFERGVSYVGLDYPAKDGVGIAVRMKGRENTERLSGTIERVPMKDGCADCVLSTQVLEHVESPTTVVDEIERILKIGGVAIVSTHGVFPVHPCPNDYWRWTDSGLRRLFERFDKVQVIAANSTFGTLASLLEDQVHYHLFMRKSRVWIACQLSIGWLINLVGDVAEKIRSNALSDRPLVGVYVVVATRLRE